MIFWVQLRLPYAQSSILSLVWFSSGLIFLPVQKPLIRAKTLLKAVDHFLTDWPSQFHVINNLRVFAWMGDSLTWFFFKESSSWTTTSISYIVSYTFLQNHPIQTYTSKLIYNTLRTMYLRKFYKCQKFKSYQK